MVQCSKCTSDAVTFIRYSGNHLCASHFKEFVERRVKKELRSQVDLDVVKEIAVAVSGGKDSCVALSIINDIIGSRKDVNIRCITVDEGIAGYRPESIEKVRVLCNSLDIEHVVVSFKDVIGVDMDEIADLIGQRTPCAYCGVFRRRCMNKAAREMGAQALATGHNLDDTSQAVLMNFTRGDVERLARMGPHIRAQPGLIPRIAPLRQIPEKEVYLYAILQDIDFVDAKCPYWEAALRNEYRDIIDNIESRTPGSRHSIVASYDALRPLLREKFPQSVLRICECGEPAPTGKCMSCTMIREISNRKSIEKYP
ncbi:MAG: TIGR00269 family protein [Euryarchaeota archaeon]|nr:TIGR00269 family protein [Euryarchaeota archaeon]